VAKAAPLDLVALIDVPGVEAAAPPARRVAAAMLLAFAAPVAVGSPFIRAAITAGPPDFAVPGVGVSPPARTPAAAGRRYDRAGVPPRAGAARLALAVTISTWRPTRAALGLVIYFVCATPIDREDAMAAAPQWDRGAD